MDIPIVFLYKLPIAVKHSFAVLIYTSAGIIWQLISVHGSSSFVEAHD